MITNRSARASSSTHILRHPAAEVSATQGSRPRAAVALHGHTLHSRESLTELHQRLGRLPLVASLMRREERRYRESHDLDIDLSHASWRPPVTPDQAHALESQAIASRLGLPALVSITDHDTIDGGLDLAHQMGADRAPVSLEWSVPGPAARFRLGVHNLPLRRAVRIFGELERHRLKPEESNLSDLLAWLSDTPSVLVVLNHPFWDRDDLGPGAHLGALTELLHRNRGWIHALELNASRPRTENRAVLRLGEELGMAVVSGGDRHTRAPSPALNLTRATTFDGFVDEIRGEGRSEVLLMPELFEPLPLRRLETVVQLLGNDPSLPVDRRRWTDRVFLEREDGRTLALSSLWGDRGPAWVRHGLGLVRLAANPRLRPALRLALGGAAAAA